MEKKYPKVGFGIMVLKDNKILLGKRNDDAEKASSQLHGEGTWTMPGGKLHFQETRVFFLVPAQEVPLRKTRHADAKGPVKMPANIAA